MYIHVCINAIQCFRYATCYKLLPSVIWHCWLGLGRQEGHPACKKMGDGGGGHWLVWMEWRPAASVSLPLHHKLQKFYSGTGSTGWSRKRAINGCVCVCACVYLLQVATSIHINYFLHLYWMQVEGAIFLCLPIMRKFNKVPCTNKLQLDSS